MRDRKKVDTVWVSGHRFLTTTGSGHTLVMDNPNREDGAAASPMEVLLASLAACSGIDVVLILEKMRQPLERLEISVEGTRREEEPRVYEELTMVYRVWGEGLDSKKVLRAVNLSEEKYCSVTAMLQSTADITTRIELNGSLIVS